MKKRRMYFFLKRTFDIVSSFMAIFVLSPFLIIIAFLIKCTSKGPIFFKQNRIGKNKKIFKILKFRTMRITAPKNAPTHLLANSEAYITRVGKILRKLSLDELPQLFNIFSGKMSVIGPRPALWNQDDLIDERDKYNANSIKPGLSGLAQVSGRDELDIMNKARLDGEYVKKMNIFFDIKLIILTVFKVFKKEGVKEGLVLNKTDALDISNKTQEEEKVTL